ncbi:uncharacterized protein LOC124294572 [Neodiprion lecontei]|uniref:Uncharacterized protein LOC124294572 n=1 Tax=Neodiprion lecontei TaxID=441921 RepID=A0ABM3G7W4_NEOLC|nr:uncharacterized protein LOC124294572 [Neodiprion lecontei]
MTVSWHAVQRYAECQQVLGPVIVIGNLRYDNTKRVSYGAITDQSTQRVPRKIPSPLRNAIHESKVQPNSLICFRLYNEKEAACAMIKPTRRYRPKLSEGEKTGLYNGATTFDFFDEIKRK